MTDEFYHGVLIRQVDDLAKSGDFNADEQFSDYDEVRADGAIRIMPTKPDTEIAKEIRAEVGQHLGDLCAVLNRAKDQGFVVSFLLQNDAMGRQFISQLIVAKHF